MNSTKCQGVGLGLRIPHIHHVIRERPTIPWFEIHVCNFLNDGLNPALLDQVRSSYPLSFHGVNLNLGGVDPLNYQYLKNLKQAISRFEPQLISDHACFTSHAGHYFHDLMPVPFTEESVRRMADRISTVQDFLGRQISIENVSRYYSHPNNQLTEGEFLTEVCQKSDCNLLVDLNNVYINQHNLDESLCDFLNDLPFQRITEVHLAGHSQHEDRLIDTHDSTISDNVWDIFEIFCRDNSDIPCLIEWDTDLPDFSMLVSEKCQADKILERAKTYRGSPFCQV